LITTAPVVCQTTPRYVGVVSRKSKWRRWTENPKYISAVSPTQSTDSKH
jgi:hypothetical protein